jgi:predicted dinucleotide-binding enzyme
MTHAIIGSGAIGHAIATQFARKRIELIVSNSRGPQSLVDLVRELGPTVRAGSVREAVQADIVILALPFTAVQEAVAAVVGWNNRILVDATNAIEFPAFTPLDLGGRPSSEVVADAVRGARVVKAFNTLPAAVLASDPSLESGRRVVFLSGNDPKANHEVSELIERLGFAAIDLGRLSEGGRLQQFGAPLVSQNLIKYPGPTR